MARGAKVCMGSGNTGNFSPGAAARMITLNTNRYTALDFPQFQRMNKTALQCFSPTTTSLAQGAKNIKLRVIYKQSLQVGTAINTTQGYDDLKLKKKIHTR